MDAAIPCQLIPATMVSRRWHGRYSIDPGHASSNNARVQEAVSPASVAGAGVRGGDHTAAIGGAMAPLEELIFARLHEALSHHAAARISVPDARCGLATDGPDEPVIRLTVEDVARIAAQVADEYVTA
jgi:hypothetical protein